jgi:hypothetical protein
MIVMYDNEVDKFAKAGKSMSVWLLAGNNCTYYLVVSGFYYLN